MIESWGSVYNDEGKIYALSHLYLAPKNGFVYPIVIKNKQWRSRKVLDSASTSTPTPNDASTYDENEEIVGQSKKMTWKDVVSGEKNKQKEDCSTSCPNQINEEDSVPNRRRLSIQ
ncbi:hypothetical protein AMTRI_Chr09g36380 [Amborella trichopoda]